MLGFIVGNSVGNNVIGLVFAGALDGGAERDCAGALGGFANGELVVLAEGSIVVCVFVGGTMGFREGVFEKAAGDFVVVTIGFLVGSATGNSTVGFINTGGDSGDVGDFRGTLAGPGNGVGFPVIAFPGTADGFMETTGSFGDESCTVGSGAVGLTSGPAGVNDGELSDDGVANTGVCCGTVDGSMDPDFPVGDFVLGSEGALEAGNSTVGLPIGMMGVDGNCAEGELGDHSIGEGASTTIETGVDPTGDFNGVAGPTELDGFSGNDGPLIVGDGSPGLSIDVVGFDGGLGGETIGDKVARDGEGSSPDCVEGGGGVLGSETDGWDPDGEASGTAPGPAYGDSIGDAVGDKVAVLGWADCAGPLVRFSFGLFAG
jgi:hypothetical protein